MSIAKTIILVILVSSIVVLFIVSLYLIMYGLYTDHKNKDLYKADKAPGALWKAYINILSGKITFMSERVSEEYVKTAYGAVRMPALDYRIPSKANEKS